MSKFLIVLGLTILMMPTSYAALQSLIEIETLYAQRNQPNLVILDLRSHDKYQKGHIPNAINIPFKKFQRSKNGVEGFVIAPQTFQELMQQAGIKNSDQVVIYSDWAYLESARIFWVFDLYGHRNIKVLNGGFQAWHKSSYPLSQQAHKLSKSHYLVEFNPEKLATKLQTLIASYNPKDYLIIDARPRDQFQGKSSLTNRKGHIPNAINLPWYELVNGREQQDGYQHTQKVTKLIDWEDLKTKLSTLPKDKKIILYCNGGMESSILYMGLKQLNKNTQLYDGSWFEWSDDTSLPIQKEKQINEFTTQD